MSVATGTQHAPAQAAPRAVFSLWMGGELPPLAVASIASFVELGHEFTLYAYEPVANLPDGAVAADAQELLETRRVRWLLERGKYALVSNLFRYETLRRRGGIWVDTDLIALRPFDFPPDELVLGYQEDGVVNGAVLGAPAGHPFVEDLYRHALSPRLRIPWKEKSLPFRTRVDRAVGLLRHGRTYRLAQAPWGVVGPSLVTSVVRKRGLGASVRDPTAFYPIGWSEVDLLLGSADAADGRIHAETYTVHLWNELLVRRGVVTPPPGSLLESLCAGRLRVQSRA